MTEGIFVLRGSPTDEELAALAIALRAVGEEMESRRQTEANPWSPQVNVPRIRPALGPESWWSSQFQSL